MKRPKQSVRSWAHLSYTSKVFLLFFFRKLFFLVLFFFFPCCCCTSWVIMSALTPQSDMPTPTTDKITQAAMETIYLCKFRVSMDGEWLCLRELDDISLTPDPEPTHEGTVRFSASGSPQPPHCYGRCTSWEGVSLGWDALGLPGEPGHHLTYQKATSVLQIAVGIWCVIYNPPFHRDRLVVYFNFLRRIRKDQVSVSQEATYHIIYSITTVIMTSILELYLSDVSFYSRSTLKILPSVCTWPVGSFGKPQVITQLCWLSSDNSITSLAAHFCWPCCCLLWLRSLKCAGVTRLALCWERICRLGWWWKQFNTRSGETRTESFVKTEGRKKKTHQEDSDALPYQ